MVSILVNEKYKTVQNMNYYISNPPPPIQTINQNIITNLNMEEKISSKNKIKYKNFWRYPRELFNISSLPPSLKYDNVMHMYNSKETEWGFTEPK